MKIHQYKCTLLTDVVLSSNSATQGYNQSLDYIPGSKFLGISSKLYDMSKEQQTLDFFHNGSVRFGDATPFIDNETCLSVPFSWYTDKNKSLVNSNIHLHHADKQESAEVPLQPKQARLGYFTPNSKHYVEIEQSFSIKSAYDTQKRKSEDGLMYGYFSLPKGSTWVFTVSVKDGIEHDLIKGNLVGKHRIGRSHSAEYGLIQISYDKELNASSTESTYQGSLIIYAQSNLCFYNANGNSTAQPSAEQLTGLSGAEIEWSKSQIRTRIYKTWNSYRSNRDADRLIIEKGSVFVVNLKGQSASSQFFQKGLGSHLAEGFGQVLINPDFLDVKNTGKFRLEKHKLDFEENNLKLLYPINAPEAENELILGKLKSIVTLKDFELEVDKKANEYYKETKGLYANVTPSQWGQLRALAKRSTNIEAFLKEAFDEKEGLFTNGVSGHVWRDFRAKNLTAKVINDISKEQQLAFIIKLSNLMAKPKA